MSQPVRFVAKSKQCTRNDSYYDEERYYSIDRPSTLSLGLSLSLPVSIILFAHSLVCEDEMVVMCATSNPNYNNPNNLLVKMKWWLCVS